MKSKERIIWVLLSSILSLSLLFFALPPAAGASPVSKETVQYLQMFEWLFRYVQDNYVDEVSSEELYQGAVKGLFESLNDPYSVYLTPEDMEDFSDTTTGRFGGVGLYISKQAGPAPELTPESSFRERNFQYIEVISPIEGTPAYRAGISAGDFIISVEDQTTKGLNTDEVADLLRGTPGTGVTFRIRRRGGIEFDKTLTRAVIEVPTIRYDMIKRDIGYLRIIQWTPYTDDRIREALNFFENKNYKGLILDVRGNPGGLLTSVVDTSDLFLSGGTIVSTKSRDGRDDEIFTASRSTAVSDDIPIVLLINQGSASASEILAGALKDSQRATLMGETTFGKGSVQSIRAFGPDGFKITTARYYTPAGINIDKIGVEPDIQVTPEELSDEDLEDLRILVEDHRIPDFVRENPSPSAGKIDSFTQGLTREGIELPEALLHKMIRDEINRTNNEPPIYDLEYDVVLQQAVGLLQER